MKLKFDRANLSITHIGFMCTTTPPNVGLFYSKLSEDNY